MNFTVHNNKTVIELLKQLGAGSVPTHAPTPYLRYFANYNTFVGSDKITSILLYPEQLTQLILITDKAARRVLLEEFIKDAKV